MNFSKRLKLLGALCLFLFSGNAAAEPNYHTVGWVNTVVPGGGQFLLGNYAYGALQATLEIGTFLWGYNQSRLSPLTLDGVPDSLPTPRVLARRRNGNSFSTRSVDVRKAIYADWAQEFGIKYHFVNIFDAYRTAAKLAPEGSQKIDDTPKNQLFLAPFAWKNLSNIWVYPAIGITAAALIYNYQQALRPGGMSRVSRLNTASQRLYDFTYVGVFPAGGAAPEEMFYRGFMQHEFFSASSSELTSVIASTAAYTFSHSAEDRLSAAITGAYLGIVTNAHHGSLSQAITYHFWADVMAGLYQITVVRKESGKVPLFHFSLDF